MANKEINDLYVSPKELEDNVHDAMIKASAAGLTNAKYTTEVTTVIKAALEGGMNPDIDVFRGGERLKLKDFLVELKADNTLKAWNEAKKTYKEEKLSSSDLDSSMTSLLERRHQFMNMNSSAEEVKAEEVNKITAGIMDLIKKGADPNKTHSLHSGENITPMHFLGAVGAAEEFKQAVTMYKGEPNIKDVDGKTPAHYFVSNRLNYDTHGNRHIPEMFIAMQEAKVDFKATDNLGRTLKDAFYNMVKEDIVRGSKGGPETVTDYQVEKRIWDLGHQKEMADDNSKYLMTKGALELIEQGKKVPRPVQEVIKEQKEPSQSWGEWFKGWLGESGVKLQDVGEGEKLQAMTQRGAVEKGTTQIT